MAPQKILMPPLGQNPGSATEYTKLPVTMKMWKQFNVMPRKISSAVTTANNSHLPFPLAYYSMNN